MAKKTTLADPDPEEEPEEVSQTDSINTAPLTWNPVPNGVHPCPSCGYCPTCGRRNGYYGYVYPYWQYPSWQQPTITWSSTGGNIQNVC